MHELTQLIKEDMRPALGVTEPGAIAYAVSKAKSYVPGELEQVTLLLNSGMYKNAYTCCLLYTSFVALVNEDQVENVELTLGNSFMFSHAEIVE